MKTTIKNFFVLSILSFITFSCSDPIGLQDWIIEMKMVTTVSPSTSGYPQTTYSTVEKLDITAKQADDIVKGLSQKTTSTSSGYTVTITTTAAKFLKSEYKPRSCTTTSTTTEKF
jgi:hypothetical protein